MYLQTPYKISYDTQKYDFRLVEPSKFVPNEAGSINMKAKFNVGGYFEKI